jgi:primary-amine oxidase
VGEAVGLTLLPGETALPLADSTAWIRRRAGFMNAQLWVTPYRRGELYAAGDYPNQSRGGDGLPHFTRTNAPVANRDVVLWYTMGITHLPRTEDWPIMPVHVAGFRLVPTGLFDRNPLIDAPRMPE